MGLKRKKITFRLCDFNSEHIQGEQLQKSSRIQRYRRML